MCDFNAKHVLGLRRQIASDEELHWHLQAALIRAIDEARIKHTHNDGCDCWQKAVEAA